jgi:phosphatidylinositol dimannoside acyltransferase
MSAFVSTVKLLAHLPLGIRRPALYALWRMGLTVRREVGYGLEPTIIRSLKMSERQARQIAVEYDFHDMLQGMEWYASTLKNERQVRADFRHTKVDDPDMLHRLASTGDPVILAPLHMGIFPLGILYVLMHFFPARRVLVLRARDDLPENTAAMARLSEVASELRILNTNNEAEFLDAMRFARKGAVVVCLFDLPPSYGSPAEMSLFGEPASMALGMDSMARMLKAVVMPMAVRSRFNGETILCGQPFEVETTFTSERLNLAAALARQIERFVNTAPAQWHMWTRLHEFRVLQPFIRDEEEIMLGDQAPQATGAVNAAA